MPGRFWPPWSIRPMMPSSPRRSTARLPPGTLRRGRLLGYTAAEIIGQPITVLIPPDRREEERHIIENLRAGKRIEHYETVRVTKDGRLIDVALTISPVRDQTGQIVGASKILRDITERKRIERECKSCSQNAINSWRANVLPAAKQSA
jgi:PAS domain S-box-containing protein